MSGSAPSDVVFNSTAVVPIAVTTITPAMIAVFALLHAITFNAPWIRVKVEAETTALFAIAAAATDVVSAAGTVWTECAVIALLRIAVVEFTPRLEKTSAIFPGRD